MPSQEQQEISLLKGRVSRLEARLEFLYKHLGVTFVEDTRATDDPKVIAALKANNLMEAVKLYRATHNVGFQEAQSVVEEIRARWGIQELRLFVLEYQRRRNIWNMLAWVQPE